MSEIFWIGTILGAALGGIHFIQTIATRLGKPGTNAIATFWQALWNWALWTLFGAYLLVFWTLGLALYALFGHTRGKARAR